MLPCYTCRRDCGTQESVDTLFIEGHDRIVCHECYERALTQEAVPIVMSIHHEWAEKIYAGEKTVELRKTRPLRRRDWCKVFFYDTTIKAVTGFAIIDNVKSVREVDVELVSASGVAKERIEAYRSVGRVYAWRIRSTQKFDEPTDVSRYGVQRVPQSWQYARL